MEFPGSAIKELLGWHQKEADADRLLNQFARLLEN